jgi:hypothetical protein
MTRAALAAAALALAVAGCSKGSAGPAFRLAQPSSVAVFLGFSDKREENGVQRLWPYAVVANTGQDELVVFDPVDDGVLPAPIVIRPLSIPLPTPRPAMVASASFSKPPQTGDTAVSERPDLLVAVAAASSELQLVRTWHSKLDAGGHPVDPQPGLAGGQAIELGGEVASLVAAPQLDASGNPVPDRVRVIAALTGGRLVVVDYQWSGDPTQPETPAGDNAVAPVGGAMVIQALGFDALSLAVDPALKGDLAAEPTPPARPPLRNPRYLYAATQDPITDAQVLGVAELDMAGDPPWSIRALNAHGPTLLVAALTLWERVTGVAGAYDQIAKPAPGVGDQSAFQMVQADGVTPADPVRRVYAYRDPSTCGPTTGQRCGMVVLDPIAGDLLEDPWHPGESTKRYLPAIGLPARPVALVAAPPAWNPPADDIYGESDPIPSPPPSTPGFHHRFMSIATSPGPRLTTGVLFIPSEDGRSYVADVARWEVPSNSYELSPLGSLAQVNSFRQSEIDLPQIGFYIPKNVADADATNGDLPRQAWDPGVGAKNYIQLTPGFTPDDFWTVTYQGYLPAFMASRPAQIDNQGLPAGQLRVAVQSSSTAQVVNVFDPALGVRVGDIVEFWTAGSSSQTDRCPDTSKTNASGEAIAPIEGKIVQVAAPDAQHPGGSLVVQRGDCVPIGEINTTLCDSLEHGPWFDASNPGYLSNGCWDQLATPAAGASQQVRIRASGGGDPSTTDLVDREFVLVGTRTGYAGRAKSIAAPPAPADPAFRFSNDDETAVTCPLVLSDPASVSACDELGCRRACEAVAVARRARRIRLTSAYCGKNATESRDSRNYCETYFPAFADPALQVAPGSSGAPRPPAGTFTGEPPTGPALAFSLGVQQPQNATVPKQLVRDTQVLFATQSGHSPAARYGGGASGGAAIGPMGATYFDRSYWDADKKTDRYRFYVPHVGDLILDTSPSHMNSGTHVIR